MIEEAVKLDDMDLMSKAELEEIRSENDILLNEMEANVAEMSAEQREAFTELASELDPELAALRQRQKDRFDTNYIDHDFGSAREEQDDWYMRGRNSKLTKEERKARHHKNEEIWELKGALYMILFIIFFGSCAYYFCIRRKNLRSQSQMQYQHVMPT